ncbi:MAG: RDD family protein [Dermatophilaceae bacterium]
MPPYGAPQGTTYGQLAQWPQRALGFLVDLSLYIPGIVLMAIGGPKTVTVRTASGATAFSTTGPSAIYFIGILLNLGVFVWNRCIQNGQGQTVGRKAMGTRLIDVNGNTLGAGKAFVRDLAHFIDSIICYVGWFFPLWDVRRQTIADKTMNTTVIVLPKG